MKKYVKILGIILVIIIVIGLIFCFIDNARIRKGKVPVFCYDDSGGSIILYYGLGYTIYGAYDDNPGGLKYCKIYTWIGWIKEIIKREVNFQIKQQVLRNLEEIEDSNLEIMESQEEIKENEEEIIESKKETTEKKEKIKENNKEIIENKKDIQENLNSKVIVIDPGHQAKGNSEKEPIGPGAEETKAKVTTGATGVVTKQKESELNLKVSLLLQEELSKKGYTVIMTRTTNDVNMSNSERAHIANHAKADIFIRIHANSSSSSSVKGVLTMCQTEKNKYNGYLQQESYRLSKLVVDNISKSTGANNRGVTQTDNMSGINWCIVPTTIVEMGFLSNPEEDKLMETQEYQKKVVEGIIKGVEEYFVE